LNQADPITAAPHLRLVWPQWQGAGTESVRSVAAEFPFDIARRGYSVGTKVLQAVLPEHDGPTAMVPVEMGDMGLEERDGIEAKAVVVQQLRSALAIIQEHEPARITTVGGECSVSMAPLSYLINKYGDDLAILWIDSHPDMGTGEIAYSGFHAMVVSALAGHVAIHFDVDTIDADEIQLGLGADLGGLTSTQTRRVVADIDGAAEVVALTIAEFIPRQVMHLQQILAGFPLLGPRA
jgi:arginase family enzyme